MPQVLEDWNESQRIWLSPEEFESENDASQTPPNRILKLADQDRLVKEDRRFLNINHQYHHS